MPRTLTAADRSALIRLASTLPAGSAERRAILAGLSKKAMAFRFPQFPIKGVGDKVTVMGTFEAGTEPSKYGEPQGRKVRLTPDTPDGYVLDVIKGYKSNPSSALIDQMGGGAWANDEPDQYLVNFGGMKVYVTQDDWDAKKIMAVPPAKEWASSLLRASQDDIIEQLRVLNGGRHLDLLPHELEKVWDKKHGRGAWANLLVTNLTKNMNMGRRELKFIQDEALKMIRTSSSDRSALIRLASSMPAGSPERKAILKGLSKSAAESFDSFESNEVYRREALSLIEKLGRRHGIKVDKITNAAAVGQKVDDEYGTFTDFRWELVLPATDDPKRQEVKIGYLDRSGFAAFRRPRSLGYFDVSRLSPEQLVKKHLLNVILTASWEPPPPSKKRQKKLPKRLQDIRLASTLRWFP